MKEVYNHDEIVHNLDSPDQILPILFSFCKPNSVLDVGCGIGTWLCSVKRFAINAVLGLDGDFVNRELLSKYIFDDEFISIDLRMPFNLERKYDLAICLEVVEHLPKDSSETIVNSLVTHSDIILFSAAIPGQGGQNHINEQWPDYWANKFQKHGYVFLDLIRPLIWDNPKVDYWYKQNIFLVVKSDHELAIRHPSSSLSLVHPDLYLFKNYNYIRRIESLEKQLQINPIKRWIKKLIKL